VIDRRSEAVQKGDGAESRASRARPVTVTAQDRRGTEQPLDLFDEDPREGCDRVSKSGGSRRGRGAGRRKRGMLIMDTFSGGSGPWAERGYPTPRHPVASPAPAGSICRHRHPPSLRRLRGPGSREPAAHWSTVGRIHWSSWTGCAHDSCSC
jgi:hypothetical protein